jgi:hypothetical protein
MGLGRRLGEDIQMSRISALACLSFLLATTLVAIASAQLPAPPPPAAPLAPDPTPAAPAPPAPSPPVVAAEQVAPEELTGLLGQVVLGPGAAHLGRIVDVLADGQGRLRAVVIDVGGFMGVGNRQVAVAWSALQFTASEKGPVISISIPSDRIKSWAEFIAGRPVAILGTTGPGSTGTGTTGGSR